MLKSLEITGFKSFGKKAVISIDAPITAVVGPNGSGKSNVVESIRFVLGEQSMKSLRGKGQSDLLFKGSKGANPSNKLKVSIVFDNSKRVLNLNSDSGKNISLDFDTVTVSRELYADGKSVYSIQNSEVRLKDVTDLLSSVHIGASGHHIISQGEADRLLSASNKDRRSMIDDALGLRVYELRIRDAERKLEKAKQNITEIEAARRELAPHLKFLEKQVEKLNQAEEARRELSIRYFNYEKSAQEIINIKQQDIEKQIFNVEQELLKYPEPKEETIEENSLNEIFPIKESLERLIGEKAVLLRTRETLERNLGRTEGLIEALRTPKKIQTNNSSLDFVRIDSKDFKIFFDNLYSEINDLLNEASLENIKSSLSLIAKKAQEFSSGYSEKINNKTEELNNELSGDELNNALEVEQDLRSQIEQNKKSIELLEKDEAILRQNLLNKESEIRLREADKYKARVEAVRLNSDKQRLMSEMDRIFADIAMLKEEKLIFEPFLVYALENADSDIAPIGKDALANERRALERLRMKLEDIGGGSSSDIVKEYEDTKQREEYLRKELNDVNSSIGSLLGLINDLRETVRSEFSKGIEKINKEFGEFFKAMFGGGNAFLSLTQEVKKSKLNSLEIDEESIEEDEDNNLPKFERGVEIHVDLPNKKVKELSMLSGGERSLVSIALLFAMSQVNPPPFLVLDETDAALDEANSRRYGDMLERLSASTQLLVVTHNRETMSRAGTIYGVTMGSDAVSKLLSIEFKDAIKVAK